MTINELIINTRSNTKAIKKEHKVLTTFQKQNPHLIEGVLNELKLRLEKGEKTDLPTFDSLLTFKTDFLIDDMSKVYKQISKSTNTDCRICFYKIAPDFFQEQQQKGFTYGDVDDLGYIVTGSNLVIETTMVKRNDFLYHYYGTCN
jgi:hypothetical protein